MLRDYFTEEKSGIVPSTKWKLKNIGSGWLLGETLLTGIGQGYIQSTPIQLCLMMAQIANGGFKIRPRIIDDGKINIKEIKANISSKLQNFNDGLNSQSFTKEQISKLMKSDYDYLNPLFRNPENVKFVKDALFGVMNEPMGTAYGSRLNSKKYQYAGKTGTSQIKRITEEERELEIKNIDKAYEDRDHAVFIGFGPYENPRYALSVFIEHGGSGSTGAAPLAKKMLKLVFDRHEAREKITHERMIEV